MTAPIGPLRSALQGASLGRPFDQAMRLAGQLEQAAKVGGAGGPAEPGLPPLTGGDALGGPSFKDTLSRALGEVSAVRDRAAEAQKAFASGEPIELHQVMAASEEAGLALDLVVELRNKVVEAYRSLINMQT